MHSSKPTLEDVGTRTSPEHVQIDSVVINDDVVLAVFVEDGIYSVREIGNGIPNPWSIIETDSEEEALGFIYGAKYMAVNT